MVRRGLGPDSEPPPQNAVPRPRRVAQERAQTVSGGCQSLRAFGGWVVFLGGLWRGIGIPRITVAGGPTRLPQGPSGAQCVGTRGWPMPRALELTPRKPASDPQIPPQNVAYFCAIPDVARSSSPPPPVRPDLRRAPAGDQPPSAAHQPPSGSAALRRWRVTRRSFTAPFHSHHRDRHPAAALSEKRTISSLNTAPVADWEPRRPHNTVDPAFQPIETVAVFLQNFGQTRWSTAPNQRPITKGLHKKRTCPPCRPTVFEPAPPPPVAHVKREACRRGGPGTRGAPRWPRSSHATHTWGGGGGLTRRGAPFRTTLCEWTWAHTSDAPNVRREKGGGTSASFRGRPF